MNKKVFFPEGLLFDLFPRVEKRIPKLLQNNRDWEGCIVVDQKTRGTNSHFTRLQCKYRNPIEIEGIEISVLIHRFWKQPLIQNAHKHRGAFASRNHATKETVEGVTSKELAELKLITHFVKKETEQYTPIDFHHKERYSIEESDQVEHYVVPRTDMWTLVIAIFDSKREKSMIDRLPLTIPPLIELLDEARFVYN